MANDKQRAMMALLHYVAPQVPSSTHLRIVVARSDFEAYRKLGEPLVGCGWRKSAEFAYPDGSTEGAWRRLTHRVWMAHQPWWARWTGRLIAFAFAFAFAAGAVR